MTNPEQSVIDAIDALVNESLSVGPVDDYSVNRYDRCPLCADDWHGLPKWIDRLRRDCPGACADEPTQAAYREMYPDPQVPVDLRDLRHQFESMPAVSYDEVRQLHRAEIAAAYGLPETLIAPAPRIEIARPHGVVAVGRQRIAYAELRSGHIYTRARLPVFFTVGGRQTGQAPTWNVVAGITYTCVALWNAPQDGDLVAEIPLTPAITTTAGRISLTSLNIPQDLSARLPSPILTRDRQGRVVEEAMTSEQYRRRQEAQQEVCDRVCREMTERGIFNTVPRTDPSEAAEHIWNAIEEVNHEGRRLRG